MKKNPEYDKIKIYGGLTLPLDKNEKQKISFFYHETIHKGDAGRVYRGYDNQYRTFNFGYDISLKDNLHLQSHLGIRSYDRDWQESIYGIIDTLKSNNGVNQVIIPADISIAWQYEKKSLTSIGIDYQRATYTTWSDPLIGYQILGNKSGSIQSGIYFQEEWHPVNKLMIRGGIRYTYTKNLVSLVNSISPDNNTTSWEKLIWSAGGKFSLNEMIAVFANGGSSFAPPGIKSAIGTIPIGDFKVPGHNGQLPNPGLKPEMGTGVDFGTECKLAMHLKVDARLFYTILNKAIIDNIVSQNPSQTQSINATSDSKGGEIEVSQRINNELSWFANVTLIASNIKNDSNLIMNNVAIPFSPNRILNFGINYSAPFGLTLAPTLNYNGGYFDSMSKTERTRFTPGVLVNIYIAQCIAKSNSFRVECTAQLYNITNNNYEMPWQFKNTGFSCMFGLKITFK